MRRKPLLTIANIGRTRFWMSIALGGITSLILFLFFMYGWEALRFATAINTDLLRFSNGLWHTYTAFLAAVALTLGCTMTTHLWITAVPKRMRVLRGQRRIGLTHIWGQFWVVLWVLTQFSLVVYLGVFVVHGYANQLDFFHHYWLILCLLPAVLFLHQWSMLRLVYRVRQWWLVSLGVLGVGIGLFTLGSPVTPAPLNHFYATQYHTEYTYLDSVCTAVHDQYGITLAESTRTVLREWYTPQAMAQLEAVQRAFLHSKPVSLDTIVLADIVMHNLKMPERPWYHPASRDHWPYVWPDDILRQIDLYRPNTPAVTLLLRLFRTQIRLVNAPGNRGVMGADYASRRSRIAQFGVPESLITRMRAVRQTMVSTAWYTQSAVRLPPIHPPVPWGSQPPAVKILRK